MKEFFIDTVRTYFKTFINKVSASMRVTFFFNFTDFWSIFALF